MDTYHHCTHVGLQGSMGYMYTTHAKMECQFVFYYSFHWMEGLYPKFNSGCDGNTVNLFKIHLVL